MTNRFKSFAVLVHLTLPHVFKSFHSGEHFGKFAFAKKTIHHFRVDGRQKCNNIFFYSCGRAAVVNIFLQFIN